VLGLLSTPSVIGLVGFLAGVVACVLLAVVEYGAWALVVAPRAREKEGSEADSSHGPGEANPDPALPISVEAADGAKLAGLWYPAEGAEPAGRMVILLHGFAEPPGSVQAPRVAFLTRRGWYVAAIDLRGFGKSDGPFASFGGREAGDVRRWIDRLTELVGPAQPLVPVLWGRSMGAAIAIRAAAEDHRIKAVILESPMVDLDAAMAVWFRKRYFPFPSFLARLVTRRAGKIAGVSLTRPRPLDLASRVACPVLMIHGAEDTLVTAAEARRLAAAFPNTPDLVEVPAAGHADVVAVGGDDLLERIGAFLLAALPTP
jgi:alpha-beta hydrolase superfamily lysophospholipase